MNRSFYIIKEVALAVPRLRHFILERCAGTDWIDIRSKGKMLFAGTVILTVSALVFRQVSDDTL